MVSFASLLVSASGSGGVGLKVLQIVTGSPVPEGRKAARLKYTENRALSGGLRYSGRLHPAGLLILISRGFRALFFCRRAASCGLDPKRNGGALLLPGFVLPALLPAALPLRLPAAGLRR